MPQRLAEIGATSFRLPAEPEEIARFVYLSNAERAGSWHMAGATSHVCFRPEIGASVARSDGRVDVRNPNGSHFRFECHDRVRVFGLTLAPGQSGMRAVALVLPRGRAKIDHNTPPEGAYDEVSGRVWPICTMAGPFARVFQSQKLEARQNSSEESQVAPSMLRLETALGHITTHCGERPDGLAGMLPRSDDTSVVPSSFVACAVFYAWNASWLTAQLAP
ncbi:MAG: hypothetical protein ACR2PG_21580 [Hyphomicrobiaceae bacterium]